MNLRSVLQWLCCWALAQTSVATFPLHHHHHHPLLHWPFGTRPTDRTGTLATNRYGVITKNPSSINDHSGRFPLSLFFPTNKVNQTRPKNSNTNLYQDSFSNKWSTLPPSDQKRKNPLDNNDQTVALIDARQLSEASEQKGVNRYVPVISTKNLSSSNTPTTKEPDEKRWLTSGGNVANKENIRKMINNGNNVYQPNTPASLSATMDTSLGNVFDDKEVDKFFQTKPFSTHSTPPTKPTRSAEIGEDSSHYQPDPDFDGQPLFKATIDTNDEAKLNQMFKMDDFENIFNTDIDFF